MYLSKPSSYDKISDFPDYLLILHHFKFVSDLRFIHNILQYPVHTLSQGVRYLTIFLLSLSFCTTAALADTIPDEEGEDLEVIRVTDLQGIEVKARRQKYSKKNNPAYDLMTRIRSTAHLNDPRLLPEYSEDFYTKTVLGLNRDDASRFSEKGKLKFLSEYVDTAAHTGLPVLLLSLHETAGTLHHSLNFMKDKLEIKGERSVGVDENLAPENVSRILDDVLRNIDIYKGDIVLMQQRFVSPIGHLADNFYRYSLNDTVILDDRPHLELVFSPRSPEMFGFNGRLFVEADDSTYFIRRVEMRVPRVINLNYVDNIYITQTYYRDEYGKRHVESDDMSLELTLIPGIPSLYARRLTLNARPKFSTDRTLHNILYDANSHIVYEDANLQPWDKWDDFRLAPLSRAESGMGNMMSRLRKYPVAYWGEQILKALVNGYVTTGPNSKIDLGPINTLLSYSSIEGLRFRVGGLTTANLSDHWFGRGYVAYGCRDRKLKYNAEIEYSLVKKEYHSKEFPINSIKLHYNYDLDNIGQHYFYTNSDNVFLSLKRHASKLSLYRREAGATYQLELLNNLSFIGSFRHRIYYATPWLPFTDGFGHDRTRYTSAGFMFELRYAPGEKFVQSRGNRYPVNLDAPIFRIQHEIVPKGLLGSAFTINKTEASVAKRFWFSAFGYLDAILKGGYIWSKVYYPALMWPNANLSYTIQPESYSLMNPMEFAVDHYASVDLGYNANGLIFNHIPLVKKLKLREIITFKGLVGGLTKRNDPDLDPTLLQFPADAGVCRLRHTPYMEAGVGIDNILTCLRLDYVWRLSYRDNPGAARSGLRLSLHFSF